MRYGRIHRNKVHLRWRPLEFRWRAKVGNAKRLPCKETPCKLARSVSVLEVPSASVGTYSIKFNGLPTRLLLFFFSSFFRSSEDEDEGNLKMCQRLQRLRPWHAHPFGTGPSLHDVGGRHDVQSAITTASAPAIKFAFVAVLVRRRVL